MSKDATSTSLTANISCKLKTSPSSKDKKNPTSQLALQPEQRPVSFTKYQPIYSINTTCRGSVDQA